MMIRCSVFRSTIVMCMIMAAFCVLPVMADNLPSTQPSTEVTPPPPSAAAAPAAADVDEKLEGEVLEGYASYYAKRFIGRKTTSGQRYHPDKMTAAHYSLPLGTQVRVVNPATGQYVDVIINDRCAWKRYHFIDLSRAAAKKIGLWGKGKIRVQIIVPEDDEDE